MILTQFPEDHIQRDGFGPLFSQFLDQPPIDLPRPIKAKIETDASICAHKNDAGFIDEYEAEVIRCRQRFGQRLPRTPVKGDPFQPLENAMRAEILLRNCEQANQADGSSNNCGRTGLCELEFQRSTPKKETRSNSQAAPGENCV